MFALFYVVSSSKEIVTNLLSEHILATMSKLEAEVVVCKVEENILKEEKYGEDMKLVADQAHRFKSVKITQTDNTEAINIEW